MRDLTKRIARLEHAGPGGKTHVVVVRSGQDCEAVKQSYLRDHPEAAQGRIAFFHTNIPERLPLPVEFSQIIAPDQAGHPEGVHCNIVVVDTGLHRPMET